MIRNGLRAAFDAASIVLFISCIAVWAIILRGL